MRLILVGFGTVGQAFIRVLAENEEELRSSHHLPVHVVAIADSRGIAVSSKGLNLDLALEAKSETGSIGGYPGCGSFSPSGRIPELISSTDADVLVEVTPTNVVDAQPGLEHILTALRSGKHVVTANKGALVVAFEELKEEAGKRNLLVKFSGAVGGAVPTIDFVRSCLNGNRVLGIDGVLNGTTNYILTRMCGEGCSFGEALAEAQKMGIAEANPAYDVDGVDTACKLLILANSVMDRRARLCDVKVTGIRGVTRQMVETAAKAGRCIRLIGSVSDTISVEPREIPKEHSLCVDGVLNAVTYHTMLAGDMTLIGRGAGGRETASALLRDVIHISTIAGAGIRRGLS